MEGEKNISMTVAMVRHKKGVDSRVDFFEFDKLSNRQFRLKTGELLDLLNRPIF